MAWNELEIVHVVAMDEQHCIGVNNQLPWHLTEDLKHFKRITQGGVIVMGRKTYDSMGRALPNRVNWVLTRDTSWQADQVKVAHTLDDILNQASADVKQLQLQSIFIIGGAEIFRQTLDIADRLELTHVSLDVQGDTFYPVVPKSFQAISRQPMQDEKTGVAFEFVRYQRQPVLL
ncbi:dihydrofolate reductase [Alkanindiges illinoisensis]|uniref:dihydrofolate reductase n=1 Tax=Alkanindiges illinoisensis TaxID=197183 RepID=UPI00047DAF70|nr:dihydrofolate reductase [Alkanindiges illinoisensis]